MEYILSGGPACEAGVKAGDCIIKVNGTHVSKFNHKEVVEIIKCELTLIKHVWFVEIK